MLWVTPLFLGLHNLRPARRYSSHKPVHTITSLKIIPTNIIVLLIQNVMSTLNNYLPDVPIILPVTLIYLYTSLIYPVKEGSQDNASPFILFHSYQNHLIFSPILIVYTHSLTNPPTQRQLERWTHLGHPVWNCVSRRHLSSTSSFTPCATKSSPAETQTHTIRNWEV